VPAATSEPGTVAGWKQVPLSPRNSNFKVWNAENLAQVPESVEQPRRTTYNAKFIVEFSDISGSKEILFGIRETSQLFAPDYTNYKNFTAFAIQPNVAGKGDITLINQTTGANRIDRPLVADRAIGVTALTSPNGGDVEDNQIWEFTVSVSYDGSSHGTVKCHDTLGAETTVQITPADRKLSGRYISAAIDAGAGHAHRWSRPDYQIRYAPFIQCVQGNSPTSIILHSLIITETDN
jgi:hypothetical protein